MITNKHNLPQTIVDAVALSNAPIGGDISIPALIDAPQIRQLRKVHRVDEDVTERVWSLFSNAVHHILERANIKSIEARALKTSIEMFRRKGQELVTKATAPGNFNAEMEKQGVQYKNVADYLLSVLDAEFKGVISDRYLFDTHMHVEIEGTQIATVISLYDKEEQTMYNYKLTSVWSYVYPESRKKWDAHENCNAYILQQHGYPVKKAVIVAIFRDWSKRNANVNKDYPPQQIMEIPITLYGDAALAEYLKNRVYLHKQADNGNVVECDGKDRWATSEEYAIKAPKAKKGTGPIEYTKKALRVFDNKKLADDFIRDNNHKYDNKLLLEPRLGENRRCEEYCPVREVCPQYKKYLEAINKQSQTDSL